MKKIGNINKYEHNGNYNRTSEDLTQTLFENIDFRELSQSTSFFRSDFRCSKFINTQFYHNDFDRADFISCYFDNCLIKSCNIAASEIKNCYFNNTIFIDNEYNNTSIQECIFKDCEFPNENFLVNMKECEFISCKFNNCSFERSTTEKLSFDKCELIGTDFATMHAERHQFHNCKLVNVSVGLSYFFGYLFSNTQINEIDFLYHGDSVDLNNGKTLSCYLEKLREQDRYYEFLNAHIQFAKFDLVPDILKTSLNRIVELDQFKRKLELNNILSMYGFYSMNNVLPYNTLSNSIQILKSFPETKLSFIERLEFQAQIKKLDIILEEIYLDSNFIESANDEIAFLTFKCKTDDYNEAYTTVSNYLSAIFEHYGIKETCTFELVKKEKGSWLLTFVMIASSALLTVKFIKECSNLTVSLFEAHERILLSTQRKKLYKKQKITFSTLQKATLLSKEAGVLSSTESSSEDSILGTVNKVIELVELNS